MNQRQGLTTNLIALITLAVASVAMGASMANAAPARCFGHAATITGTNQGEELVGTSGRDVIVARGGDDRIEARGGRDLICAGGGGFDVVFAGRGHDRIAGQAGFDIAFPGPGDDFFNGGRGGGFITYEGTHTRVRADLRSGVVTAQGRDRVKNVEGVGGSEVGDVLIGNNDEFNSLEAYGGNDVVRGLGGDDFINAGAGDDTIAGGDGDHDFLDLVIAHAGPDIGDDILATSGAVADLNTGTVNGGADVGQDTFTGIEGLGATLGDDTITGDAGHNELFAFDGTDSLQGGDGDDFLAPGPGDDVADGGAGNDVADFFHSHPFEGGTHGPVTVDLGGTQTATGQGTDDINSFEGAVGTLLDDTLTGSPGADILLLGAEGSDTISGETGDDNLDGDAFFFGFPENLPGSDSLDGGPGQDVCVGGETTDECETFEPPPPATMRSSTLRTSSIASVEFFRVLWQRFYSRM